MPASDRGSQRSVRSAQVSNAGSAADRLKLFVRFASHDQDDDLRQFVLLANREDTVEKLRTQVTNHFHSLFPADRPLLFFRMHADDGFFLTDSAKLEDVLEDGGTLTCRRADKEVLDGALHAAEYGNDGTTAIRGLESLGACVRLLRMVLAQSVAAVAQLCGGVDDTAMAQHGDPVAGEPCCFIDEPDALDALCAAAMAGDGNTKIAAFRVLRVQLAAALADLDDDSLDAFWENGGAALLLHGLQSSVKDEAGSEPAEKSLIAVRREATALLLSLLKNVGTPEPGEHFIPAAQRVKESSLQHALYRVSNLGPNNIAHVAQQSLALISDNNVSTSSQLPQTRVEKTATISQTLNHTQGGTQSGGPGTEFDLSVYVRKRGDPALVETAIANLSSAQDLFFVAEPIFADAIGYALSALTSDVTGRAQNNLEVLTELANRAERQDEQLTISFCRNLADYFSRSETSAALSNWSEASLQARNQLGHFLQTAATTCEAAGTLLKFCLRLVKSGPPSLGKLGLDVMVRCCDESSVLHRSDVREAVNPKVISFIFDRCVESRDNDRDLFQGAINLLAALALDDAVRDLFFNRPELYNAVIVTISANWYQNAANDISDHGVPKTKLLAEAAHVGQTCGAEVRRAAARALMHLCGDARLRQAARQSGILLRVARTCDDTAVTNYLGIVLGTQHHSGLE